MAGGIWVGLRGASRVGGGSRFAAVAFAFVARMTGDAVRVSVLVSVIVGVGVCVSVFVAITIGVIVRVGVAISSSADISDGAG